MSAASQESAVCQSGVPWGTLPPRLRVLYIACSRRTGAWLAESFAADRAARIELEETVGAAAGLARLREDSYDAVLISHAEGELDALELIEGLRAGGAEEPAIVLGSASEEQLSAPCYEIGADAYVCVEATTTRSLIWIIARAIQRHQLIRENRRLAQAERNRLRLEHGEAERILEQQRALICELEHLHGCTLGSAAIEQAATDEYSASSARLTTAVSLQSETFDSHYRELLRAYVIMGSGNLADEMRAFADSLAAAGVSARQAIALHVRVLEELVRGLGNRSARHVMTRADLLVLEVIVHLAEGYRQRLEGCQPQLDSGESFGLVA